MVAIEQDGLGAQSSLDTLNISKHNKAKVGHLAEDNVKWIKNFSVAVDLQIEAFRLFLFQLSLVPLAFG